MELKEYQVKTLDQVKMCLRDFRSELEAGINIK